MKKRGFTLIELLAVIVILAIIALIAIPTITNIINDAKKGAAENSALGYIEAVEYHQTKALISGNGLPQGQYNIEKDSNVDGKTYEKLKSMIKANHNKVTSGYVNLNNKGEVTGATMCVDKFLVEFKNNKAKTISNDCGDLGLFIDFITSESNYDTQKDVTIVYPNGKFDYYYKIVSGKVYLGEIEQELNTPIKSNNKSITLTLKENAKIEAYVKKDDQEKFNTLYEETKIDLAPATPVATIRPGYLKLTASGAVTTQVLEVAAINQEGTSIYYSIDDGITWNNYSGQVQVSTTNIQVKTKRDISEITSELVQATVSNDIPLDAIEMSSFDNNTSTGTNYKKNGMYQYGCKALIDPALAGRNLSASTDGHLAQVVFYDENDVKISESGFKSPPIVITIPANAHSFRVFSGTNINGTLITVVKLV